MKVRTDLLRDYTLFPKGPFERGNVRQFIKFVKHNNLEEVYKMIKLDPLIVFQYDDMY